VGVRDLNLLAVPPKQYTRKERKVWRRHMGRTAREEIMSGRRRVG